MSASSPIRELGIALPLGLTVVCLLCVGLLSTMTSYSQAQSYNNFQIDFTGEGAWRYTHHPETKHQRNGRVIQDQLTGIGKQLTRLSIVDPLAYSTLQSDLQGYLQTLDSLKADYGDPGTYQAVLLWLNGFEEHVRSALSQGRWLTMNQSEVSATPDQQNLIGHTVPVYPYALLFRRADYRSKLIHLVRRGEWVKIIAIERDYYHVQCGPHKGYLGKGMVYGLLP